MPHTNEEITLCKRLHEIWKAQGKLPEIREGEWFLSLWPDGTYSEPYLFAFRVTPCAAGDVLLLSWERCRKMLRERGYQLDEHNDMGDRHRIRIKYLKPIPKSKIYGGEITAMGLTDLSAILSVMVTVAEEGR